MNESCISHVRWRFTRTPYQADRQEADYVDIGVFEELHSPADPLAHHREPAAAQRLSTKR